MDTEIEVVMPEWNGTSWGYDMDLDSFFDPERFDRELEASRPPADFYNAAAKQYHKRRRRNSSFVRPKGIKRHNSMGLLIDTLPISSVTADLSSDRFWGEPPNSPYYDAWNFVSALYPQDTHLSDYSPAECRERQFEALVNRPLWYDIPQAPQQRPQVGFDSDSVPSNFNSTPPLPPPLSADTIPLLVFSDSEDDEPATSPSSTLRACSNNNFITHSITDTTTLSGSAKRKAEKSNLSQPTKRAKSAQKTLEKAVPPHRAPMEDATFKIERPVMNTLEELAPALVAVPSADTPSLARSVPAAGGEVVGVVATPPIAFITNHTTPSPKRPKAHSKKGASVRQRLFPCSLDGCRQVCNSAGDLRRHMESRAHKAPSYPCLGCDRAPYTRIDALRRHHRNEPACKRRHMTSLKRKEDAKGGPTTIS